MIGVLADERIRRVLESFIASLLRKSVAPLLLDSARLRQTLDPETLERLRTELAKKLEEAESKGMRERTRVTDLLLRLCEAVGAGKDLIASLVKSERYIK